MNELAFSANFTGVRPTGGYIEIPDAPVTGTIKAIEVKPHKDEPGAFTATFTIEVTEAAYAGATRRTTTRVPDQTEKGRKVLPIWRTALESIGVQPAVLDSGNAVNIGASTFVGKTAHFFHTKGNRHPTTNPNGTWDNIEFITPTSYTDRKRSAGVAATTTTTATVSGPAVAAASASVAPAPAPVDLAALKSNLLL
jgi:hypothetical protein